MAVMHGSDFCPLTLQLMVKDVFLTNATNSARCLTLSKEQHDSAFIFDVGDDGWVIIGDVSIIYGYLIKEQSICVYARTHLICGVAPI